jgi:plasmid stabilization system protein ParE
LSFPVYFHPAAADEAQAALAWYAERSPRAAGRFVVALAETIEEISHSPQRFPPFHASTRRALVRRFPFLVVFRERSGQIEVIAVPHAKRRPGYWRKRLKE